jgi:hypothetical protein
MILDNENNNLKVHEWLAKYTEEGKLDIVTGYYTIGALAYLSNQVNAKIAHFRLVLGDIVNMDSIEHRPLDLLNENITIEAALKLSKLARESVDFLLQDKIEAKTLEPNFCHAKTFLFYPQNKDERYNYFISGSSNLTEAGIGLKVTNNIELNIAETGNNSQYKELTAWFDQLWEKPQAHKYKTILLENGKTEKIPFKEYLIGQIEKIFIQYTPRELYYKVLFELFGSQLLADQNDPEFNRQVGRLENSVIYNSLYEFQKKGALSLIKMLQKYNGAILADAVGLGKTWTALAVMKFFQLQGREVLLLSPKKLQHNWNRYRKFQDSKFEKDQFDYFIRFHTDLSSERLETYTDRADKFFTNDKPKLIVIDESHNLRNDKTKSYNFLLDKILKENEDVKVLMLSATPINNSLNDIRNQFKLMVQGQVNGFENLLGIRNIDYTFRSAQKAFNDWRTVPTPRISDFIKLLPADFFSLTDSLTVARTRKMIKGHQNDLFFPKIEKPENIFVTPRSLGNFENFEELFNHFPPMLSGYQPSFYLKIDDSAEKNVLYDEKQREFFLVKMMYILLVKRLESSWYSFYLTVQKIKDHHQNALDRIKAYQINKSDADLQSLEQDIFGDEAEDNFEEFTLGKKRQISIREIDEAGNLELFKKDLKKDLDALDNLYVNLKKFEQKIDKEIVKPNNHKSDDEKLQVLIGKIKQKRERADNDNNQKVVIFTVYRDTAEYLFDQFKSRGFKNIGVVTGTGSKTDDALEETKNFEPILERFAPFTKLYNEREWNFQTESKGSEAYDEWVQWIATKDPKTYHKLKNPIDLLIATDALSEGQNLQDADMVINYDIHWNPVRIIQRMGRIDRLGSPNEKIFGINFWPSNNINSYLNLQGRIEQRMATMKLAGSEVNPEFSETFALMAHDENLEHKMNARMMQQMQTTWEEIEVNDHQLGFDNLSLEQYRQELLAELNSQKNKYQQMPKGVYTGFVAEPDICTQKGMIALLGYPAKKPLEINHQYQVHDLIYINLKGEMVLLNQKEVLDALTFHKDKPRFVPDAIEKGKETEIQELVNALKLWLEKQSTEEELQEDGSTKKVMGQETKDILAKLKYGSKEALQRIKQNISVNDKFQTENFDLITWFIVS